MTYHSPFEQLMDGHQLLGFEQMGYLGSLDDVLTRLEALASPHTWPKKEYADFALHPPRIIRLIIDSHIANPQLHLEEAVQEALAYALEVYETPCKLPAKTKAFREYVTRQQPQLLSTEIKQCPDHTSWLAYMPAFSRNAARRLDSERGDSDMLFLALAHGGITAGLDVYLRAANRQQPKNSVFYVVRFSTTKMNDCFPRLSESEKERLQKTADGKKIVLFDEDVVSGSAMRTAYEFFSELFDQEEIILLTNYDANAELEKLKKKIKRRIGRTR